MSALAWALVAVAFAWLLSRARPSLRSLPSPVAAADVPAYTLWVDTDVDLPTLTPAPARVVRGPMPAADEWTTPRILRLAGSVRVAPSLPCALSACGDAMVSVVPWPRGGVGGAARERWLRDFGGADRVADLRSPAGFADERCAWFTPTDLMLPGEAAPVALRVARARKAHLLPVELRHGGAGATALVEASALSAEAFRAALPSWTARDPIVCALVGGVPLALTVATALCLFFEATRPAALLALYLGALARLWVGAREGFGLALALAGPFVEPALSWAVLRIGPPVRAGVPAAPTAPAPRLTAARGGLEARTWLDEAAVPFLVRRLGGAARVMEQLYTNTPSGRTLRGVLVDRWVHASPSARAVRWRRRAVADIAASLAPSTVLSVPSGGASDVARLNAARVVLVDPDADARALAQANAPRAEVVNATIEGAPAEVFDLCVFVGLSEYLDDNEVVRALLALRGRLAPGGALLTTTTLPNDGQRLMRDLLGWHTHGRKVEAFAALLDAAGFQIQRREIDPLGLQAVFVARPLGAPRR